jgi:RNA polymerase sigma-70 factor, ECF subfamily
MEPSRLPALDAPGFEAIVGEHRRQLLLHCYRLLGSIHEAEDAVQETLLRAWRGRAAFEGRGSVRGWLLRIATNVCLRSLERRAIARRVTPEARGPAVSFAPLGAPAPEVDWIEPCPITPLELARDPRPGPEARYESREAVRLAFIAALQGLPPRQRAALLLRDVLGLSAAEAATVLDCSVPAANSALQRARATMERRSADPGPIEVDDDAHRRLLERYVEAWEAADVDRLISLLATDATWSMPPWPQWHAGRADIGAFLAWAWRDGAGHGRLLPTWANGQPAFGYYRRAPRDARWRPFAIQVLEVAGGEVRSVTSFVDAGLFATFGLPPEPPPIPRPMNPEPAAYPDR